MNQMTVGACREPGTELGKRLSPAYCWHSCGSGFKARSKFLPASCQHLQGGGAEMVSGL